MSNNERDYFLKNEWEPYPAFESNGPGPGFQGRIAEIEGSYLTVKWNGDTRKFLLGKSSKMSRVLVVGDIVAISSSKEGDSEVEVTLLSPCKIKRPDRFVCHEVGEKWGQFLSSIRLFFKERGFLEATTPSLVPSPGMEEFLHPFSTEFEGMKGKKHLFLPTSPEFHLKKWLSCGHAKIYEIKTCFRNREAGHHHQPEFEMLEWYRTFSGLEDIKRDVVELVEGLLSTGENKRNQKEVLVITVAEVFSRVLNVALTPETSEKELRAWIEKEGLYQQSEDSWDDLFFRLMIERIEPWMNNQGPVLLTDYPPSQAALARIGTSGWAQRFEFYWNGLEIANAFDELNDPEEQRKRFANIERAREKREFSSMGRDDEFLDCLDYGLPPSAGIALGLERLFMAANGIDEISRVKPFSHS